MMSTKELQIASMMSIFFLGFVFGAVPVLGRRYTSKKRFYTTFMGLANTFAAGIFMSLSVVHLLPEVAKDFQDLEGEERNRFRIPFVMCIAGYVAVLTIERVVFVTPTCAHHMMDAQGGTVPVQAAPADDFTGLFHPEHPKVTECEQSLLQSDALNKIDPISRVRASTLGGTNPRAAHTDGLNESIPVAGSINRSCSVEGTHLVLRNSERVVQVAERIPDNTLVSKHHHGHGHAHEHSQNDVSNLGHSTITPLLLMAALLTHGVSEGLALGVETTRQSVLVLSLALISHKWAEGLALGISFSRSDTTTRRSLLYILVFSLGTPLGICLGMSLSRLNSVVGLYFQAFSCGTFLYIGASEVVVEEFIQGKRNFGKLLTFLIGFGVIYALTITDAG